MVGKPRVVRLALPPCQCPHHARVKFGALSEAIDTYASGLKLKMPEGVRVAFCPMAEKPWLQEGSTLNNPYYGKSMLDCGTLKN